MKKYLLVFIVISLFITVAGFTIHSAKDYEVPYPEGYRKWTHIKTGVVGPQNKNFQAAGGFHHIYANDKAMAGYETGNFPEGSILIFDVIEALDVNTNTLEGKRRKLNVMMKDSIKFKETGGWGFEEFKEDSKIERNVRHLVKVKCFNCHSQKKNSDFVFSTFRK